MFFSTVGFGGCSECQLWYSSSSLPVVKLCLWGLQRRHFTGDLLPYLGWVCELTQTWADVSNKVVYKWHTLALWCSKCNVSNKDFWTKDTFLCSFVKFGYSLPGLMFCFILIIRLRNLLALDAFNFTQLAPISTWCLSLYLLVPIMLLILVSFSVVIWVGVTPPPHPMCHL